VSYLPQGLLKITTILAVLSFLALTLEPAIKQLSGKFARLIWILYIAFAASVAYAFFGNTKPAPFNAAIRATTVYVGESPVSLFMVTYQSPHGPTASPVCYLMYLEFVSRQDFKVDIDHYFVEIGYFRYIPWWHKLRPIPLTEYPMFAVGVSGGNPAPGKVWFPKGTYLMKEHPEFKQELHRATLMNLTPLFESEIIKSIPAHETVQGWAAFDRANVNIGSVRDQLLKITVVDSAGNTSSTIVEMPLPDLNEIDTSRALMQPTTTEADLSDRYLKFFSQP
jgi:hypothetical protein